MNNFTKNEDTLPIRGKSVGQRGLPVNYSTQKSNLINHTSTFCMHMRMCC